MSSTDWHAEETYKSLMLYGNNAIRYVLLINGGAIIALLTFLGNLLKNSNTQIDMAWPMGLFLLGIVFGGLANMSAYFTQFSLFDETQGREATTHHHVWLKRTVAFVILGLAMFGLGSILALIELRSYT